MKDNLNNIMWDWIALILDAVPSLICYGIYRRKRNHLQHIQDTSMRLVDHSLHDRVLRQGADADYVWLQGTFSGEDVYPRQDARDWCNACDDKRKVLLKSFEDDTLVQVWESDRAERFMLRRRGIDTDKYLSIEQDVRKFNDEYNKCGDALINAVTLFENGDTVYALGQIKSHHGSIVLEVPDNGAPFVLTNHEPAYMICVLHTKLWKWKCILIISCSIGVLISSYIIYRRLPGIAACGAFQLFNRQAWNY